jgi:hypothetical protein
MRRGLPLALALLAASPVFAQVRVIAELGLPSAPVVAPTTAIAPAFSMPTLGPTLSAPSLAASPMTTAPAPVMAQAALIQTGSALSAAAKEGHDQGAVSRQAFDAGAKAPAEAPAVAGREGSSRPPALEESNSPQARIVFRPMGPIKTAITETAEVATFMIPLAFIAMIVKATMSNPAILIPSMIALWATGAWAMRGHLGGLRSTVVGGWQASHDQKYRVDPGTGRLKDIRGHKYGSDRYEEWQAGPVGKLATGLIAAAAAVAAAAFLLL